MASTERSGAKRHIKKIFATDRQTTDETAFQYLRVFFYDTDFIGSKFSKFSNVTKRAILCQMSPDIFRKILAHPFLALFLAKPTNIDFLSY